jgi:uncharacterized RDD family membrane protein YckC
MPTNPTARLPAAPVGRRLATSGLEYFLMFAALSLVTLLSIPTAFLSKLLLPFLAIYWCLRDLNGGKFSPGKRLGRFRVVSLETGQTASNFSCVLRNSYYVILIILAAVPFWDFFNMGLVTMVMILDLIVMIATPNNQRLGDLIAKTQVVPVR